MQLLRTLPLQITSHTLVRCTAKHKKLHLTFSSVIINQGDHVCIKTFTITKNLLRLNPNQGGLLRGTHTSAGGGGIYGPSIHEKILTKPQNH